MLVARPAVNEIPSGGSIIGTPPAVSLLSDERLIARTAVLEIPPDGLIVGTPPVD